MSKITILEKNKNLDQNCNKYKNKGPESLILKYGTILV
jgi:hypothetical protein